MPRKRFIRAGKWLPAPAVELTDGASARRRSSSGDTLSTWTVGVPGPRPRRQPDRRRGQGAREPRDHPPHEPGTITAATLVCHGAADPHVPLTHVARFTGEMNHAEPDWQLIIYGGAQDGFTHDVPSSTQVPGAESQGISGCLTGPSALSGYHAQGLVVSCIRHRKDHSRRHPTRRCRRTEAGRPLRSDGARNVRRPGASTPARRCTSSADSALPGVGA
jgi:hypothetical protein